MRLLDTDVRYFDSTCFDSPKIPNAWGGFITILDYALVLGSPSQPVLSLNTKSSDEESGGYWLATVLLNPGHKFKKDLSVVEISGSSDPRYNSLFRVQDVIGEDKITIAFDKSIVLEKPKDLTEPGVSIKLAPLGYEKSYESLNKAAYRSLQTNKKSNMYLRVDNSNPEGYDPTWAKFARVSVISDMEYIDDYEFRSGRVKIPHELNEYSKAEQSFGTGTSGIFGSSKWYQRLYFSSYLYETTVPPEGLGDWELIGDSKTFYFFPDVGLNTTGYRGRGGYCFGEYESNIPSDYNYILCCYYRLNLRASDTIGEYHYNPGLLEKYNNFSRTNSIEGNLLMNSQASSTLAHGVSEKFRMHCSPAENNSSSGDISTDIKLEPFKLNINFLPLSIKSESKLFKGYMRGYRFILNDLQEFKKVGIDIAFKSVVSNFYKSYNEKYVLLKTSICRASSEPGNTLVAFKLNNWE